MPVDITLLRDIGEKILLVGVGAISAWLFERRPRLNVFYGHVGAFQVQGPQPRQVHTHSVVIRNAGRLIANNVRLPHRLPLNASNIHFSIDPPMASAVQPLSARQQMKLRSGCKGHPRQVH